MECFRLGVWVFFLLASLAAVPAQASAGSAADGKTTATATELIYRVKMPGVPAYRTRYLVTRRFMRRDQGPGSRDFVLLDRKGRRVYSVSHTDRTVLVIPYRAIQTKLPTSLKLAERRRPDHKASRVGGRRPVRYTLLANDDVCSTEVVVPGLLKDAVAAMAEFERIFAGQRAMYMAKRPAAIQAPCNLARYVYASDRYLRHGIPIEQADPTGYRRTLVEYKLMTPVNPALFKLPKGFRRYSVG